MDIETLENIVKKYTDRSQYNQDLLHTKITWLEIAM